MPDSTAAAMRLAGRIVVAEAPCPAFVPPEKQERIISGMKRRVEFIARALDDAGVAEVWEAAETMADVAKSRESVTVRLIALEALAHRILAALTGSQQEERRNQPTAYSPVPGPPVNPGL